MHALLAKKPVIVAGDFNVTPTDRGVCYYTKRRMKLTTLTDLRRPEYHTNRTGCVIKQERQGWFDLCFPKAMPEEALLDAWREMNPRMDGHYRQAFSHLKYLKQLTSLQLYWVQQGSPQSWRRDANRYFPRERNPHAIISTAEQVSGLQYARMQSCSLRDPSRCLRHVRPSASRMRYRKRSF